MSRKRVTYSRKSSHAARAAHARGEREFKTYDTSAIRPKKKSKLPIIFVIAVILCIIAVIGFGVHTCSNNTDNPNLLPEGESVTVEIQDGLMATEVSSVLFDEGVIRNQYDFMNIVNSKNAATSLKPGVYTFVGGTSDADIVQMLIDGPSASGNSLTVPEGYTIDQTASAVEDAYGGSITADDFKEATSDASVYAADYSFLEDVGTQSLEGFLFPKTYDLLVNASAEDVVRQMLDQYQAEINSLDFSYPNEHSLSNYDALILASIVEKEAADDNRSTVASVFYNRLASDRPYLESDATTAFYIGADPTPEDLKQDNAYNTYLNAGLPPTPICSPSLASLQAVCNPDDTDYLFFYFVPNDQGGMDYYFSNTYEEHQQAIQNAG